MTPPGPENRGSLAVWDGLGMSWQVLHELAVLVLPGSFAYVSTADTKRWRPVYIAT